MQNMTKTELKAFRKTLEGMQAELAGAIRNREALAVENSSDELDRIQYANERDCAMKHLERNSKRLRDVRAAISLIDEGTFGTCGRCEEDINPKRLAVVPWAAFCVVCQEAVDLEEKTPWSEAEELLIQAA